MTGPAEGQRHSAESRDIAQERLLLYLKSLKQTGSRINITGYAQSNARVSNLMRNLDASPYLQNAELIEVKASVLNTRRVSEFNLNVTLERQPVESAEKPKGTPPAAGGKP